MTNRLTYNHVWAEGGVSTDPDLDTTHPSYVADKYEQQGWVSEKPPEEWQNFLTQITDQKIVSMLVDGVPEFDADVTYSEGAVYQKSGVYYTIQAGVEQECLSPQTAVYNQLVASVKQLYDGHMAADNPHHDTVDTLVDKSYIKTDVDKMFGDPTDARTINYHTSRTGPVHGETPEQLGTLPVGGGTFSGSVVSQGAFWLGPTTAVHLNPATAILEMVSGSVTVGIDASGKAWVGTSSGHSEIFTEANYDSFNIKYGYTFALPVPQFFINLENGLSDLSSIGVWSLDTAKDPVFDALQGLKTSDNAVTLSGVVSNQVHTLVVRGAAAGVNYCTAADVSARSYASISDMLAVLGTALDHVKQIWIYPKLNTYQVSMLVKS